MPSYCALELRVGTLPLAEVLSLPLWQEHEIRATSNTAGSTRHNLLCGRLVIVGRTLVDFAALKFSVTNAVVVL